MIGQERDEISGASLRLEGVRQSFGQTVALSDVSLEVLPGELMALLGPSGCGKTTALRIMAGFLFPERGSVFLGGLEITHLAPQHRDMGMVFQSYSLFPNMTVEDNVGFGLRMRGWAKARRKDRTRETLELVGLAELSRRYPHQLSGGQQQRVALARALAIRPGVLLFDEPLSALDAKVRLAIREEIRMLQRRLGITTVFVTHDQEEALSIADRVCVMNDGRILQIAPPEQLYTSPSSSFVAEFVGIMNRLSGRLVTGGVEVLGQRRNLRQICGGAEIADGSPVDVLVRPEGLGLVPLSREAETRRESDDDIERGYSDGHSDGVVTSTTFLGASLRVSVEMLDRHIIQVDLQRQAMEGVVPGVAVCLRVLDESVIVDRQRARTTPESSRVVGRDAGRDAHLPRPLLGTESLEEELALDV
jgi:putative spermidine/putrescine transport system ATP-binding protein